MQLYASRSERPPRPVSLPLRIHVDLGDCASHSQYVSLARFCGKLQGLYGLLHLSVFLTDTTLDMLQLALRISNPFRRILPFEISVS